MNVTFLIGNGFDLNSGLKSSYLDIYELYIKEQPGESQLIAKFKEDLWNNIDNWGDFEIAMADYMKTFSSEKDFLECLRDFKACAESYLLNEEKSYIDINESRLIDVINGEMNQSLTQFHKGVTHDLDLLPVNQSNMFSIVFNYTNVYDTFVNYTKLSNNYPHMVDIIHIHGRLNDDMIMGMDNASQIKDLKFQLSMKGRRAFIKNVFNQQYDRQRLENAEKYIAESDVICVFGMSLSESDLRWREMILDVLKKKENAHLFLYEYECSCLPFMGAEQRLDIEEDKKDEILSEWGVEEKDIVLLKEKIHIPCCKNIFNFKKVLDREIVKIQKEKEEYEKRKPKIIHN